MRIAIAVFVKTPGMSPVKTRLAKTIGVQAAERFYLLSAASVEAVIREVVHHSFKPDVQLCPYWALAEEAADSYPLWQRFQKIFQGNGTLGDRLNQVYCT